MAELLNKLPTNLTEYPNSFKRQTASPLEMYSVFYAKADAENYAANNGVAYVGQPIAVVENDTVVLYVIEDAEGTLKEVGTSPVGDEHTIVVAEDGTISLAGVTGLTWKNDENAEVTTYQPLLTKDAEGNAVLSWVIPSATTVEGLATRLDGIDSTIAGINTAIADINKDYLKAADKTELANATTAVSDRVGAIEADYLKAADKTELQGNIDTVSGSVTALGTRVDGVETDYKAADEALANRISALEGTTHFSGAGLLEARPETADDGDIYVATDNSKEYIWANGAWIELGDVTAEAERISDAEDAITALEGDVDELTTKVGEIEVALGGKETAGAAAQALADAKNYADSKDEAIETAQAAADKAQGEIDALEEVVAGMYTNTQIDTAISTAKDAAVKAAADANSELDERLTADISDNADAISALTETVGANKASADQSFTDVRELIATNTRNISDLSASVTAHHTDATEKFDKVNDDIAALVAEIGEPVDGDTASTGMYALIDKKANASDTYTKSEITALIQDITGGESAADVLAALNEYKGTNNARVDRLEVEVYGTQANLDTATSRIDTVSANVTELAEEVETVKTSNIGISRLVEEEGTVLVLDGGKA